VTTDRFARALAAIDAANGADPTAVDIRGRTGPKELLHADLVTEWVLRLQPDADKLLLLAARGHHLRRWTVPRSTQPAGRAGYLRWRKALQDQHARELGELLTAAGYDEAACDRVRTLVRKVGLGSDTDVQVLEDALCLVFLETQLDDVAARLEPDTLARVLVKTAHKMSDAGRACIAELPLAPGARRALDAAMTGDVVDRYLEALRAHDWPALAATLALDVVRIGPYRDRFDGRDSYVQFLEVTLAALSGYTLVVDRVVGGGTTAVVELSETVDDGDARLHTDEAVVFDVRDGVIAHIAVYLQTSERLTPGT
jgi:hypothetical protein